MDRLEVGKIVNTHGLKGEVKIVTWTDSPDVFEDIEYVYAKRKSGEEKLTLRGIKCVLTADRDMLGELPEGVYYIADLIGCTVYEEDGTERGKLTDVFNTGANDIYAVSAPQKKDLLIPVTKETVLSVDTDNKKIIVRLPEGLDEL